MHVKRCYWSWVVSASSLDRVLLESCVRALFSVFIFFPRVTINKSIVTLVAEDGWNGDLVFSSDRRSSRDGLAWFSRFAEWISKERFVLLWTTGRTTGRTFFPFANLRTMIWRMHMVLLKALRFSQYGQNPRSAEDLCLGISEFPMNADARDWLQEKQQSLNIVKDCLHEAMIRQASNADRHKLERTFLENQEVLVHRDHIGHVQTYVIVGLVLLRFYKFSISYNCQTWTPFQYSR